MCSCTVLVFCVFKQKTAYEMRISDWSSDWCSSDLVHHPALVCVPGILMLVPGSASLRGVMNLIQQQDATLCQVAALGVLNILLALVAGLLFGNLLLPTRRNL